MAMSEKKKRHSGRLISILLLLVFVAGILASLQLLRPLPAATAQAQTFSIATTKVDKLAWPAYGQAAVGAVDYGLLETKGEQKAVPIASVAKVITALSIIKQKPLQLGQTGPSITITPADVAIFNDYYAKDGSLVKVQVGEKLTEYQALQAILLPSANNVADTTAIWAFGSLSNYAAYANSFVKTLGMKNTYVADASGFSPSTTSTAEDLVLLGQAALKDPVISQIVNQKQAVIPVAGTIYNVNGMLGKNGINGIKTGNTDQAGGCFLGSAKQVIDGQEITVISAILGGPNLVKSMLDSKPLLSTTADAFQKTIILKKGQTVGNYTTMWGESSNAVLQKDITAVVWPSQQLTPRVQLQKLSAPAASGTVVGSAYIKVGGKNYSSPAALNQTIDKPTLTWRLTNYRYQ